MKIGNVNINGYAALAPMAGVADRVFRELCVEFGAAYVVGEMASAKGISMADKKSKELLSLSPKERPAAVQIFGDDPQIMAQAALRALEFEPDIIDINMGCPAPKVAGNGGGCALMKRPELAQKIVEECAKALSLPVTVKIRSGWNASSINAIDLARRAEAAGAAAVTVHGRTREQMYSPPVNIDIIRQVKQAISIPVIGNGDIVDGKTAKAMLDLTGSDLVMVGRGALGRPWVFTQINAYLKDGTVLKEPAIETRMSVMLRHMKKLCEYKGEYIGMREARKHAAWYMKGIRGAASYRQEICSLEEYQQLEELAHKVIANSY
ncbi:MAG: tRNA dihydrouridine synthase DusB [Clostridiales bacterium]|jgi:nifR3 family TIM-barrel protein|nr:tRNA dihydrouridine synthase DusB [Clostridiales bacterium]